MGCIPLLNQMIIVSYFRTPRCQIGRKCDDLIHDKVSYLISSVQTALKEGKVFL